MYNNKRVTGIKKQILRVSKLRDNRIMPVPPAGDNA